jgi:hypothetical protein
MKLKKVFCSNKNVATLIPNQLKRCVSQKRLAE